MLATLCPNAHGQGHVARFNFFGPNHIFGICEAMHFKCRLLIDTEEC